MAKKKDIRKRPLAKNRPKLPAVDVDAETGVAEPVRDFVRKYHGMEKGMRVPEWGRKAKYATVATSHDAESAMAWVVYGDPGKAGDGDCCQVERFLFVVGGKEMAYTRRNIYSILRDRQDVLARLREVETPATYSPELHTAAMCAAFEALRAFAEKKADVVYPSANIKDYKKLHIATSKVADVVTQKEIFEKFDAVPEGRKTDLMYYGVNVAPKGEARCEVQVNYQYWQGAKYDPFDSVIQDHIASLMMEHEAATGEKYLRISMNRLCASIYGEYNNPKWEPTERQVADVRDRLNVMLASRARISWEEVVKKKGVMTPREAVVSGPIVEFQTIKISAAGQIVEGYEFHVIPPAFKYSMEMRQIATVRRRLGKYSPPKNKSKQFVVLEHAIIRIVAMLKRMPPDKQIPRRRVETIIRETGEEWSAMERTAAWRIKNDIATILDGMVVEKELTGWTWAEGEEAVDFQLPPRRPLLGVIQPPLFQ